MNSSSQSPSSGGQNGPRASINPLVKLLLTIFGVVALCYFFPNIVTKGREYGTPVALGCGAMLAALVVLNWVFSPVGNKLVRIGLVLPVLTAGVLFLFGPVIRPWLTAKNAGSSQSRTIKEALHNAVEGFIPSLTPNDLLEKLVELEAKKPAKVQDLFGPNSIKTPEGTPQWLADAAKIEDGVCELFVFVRDLRRFKEVKGISWLKSEASAWTDFFSRKESKDGTTTPLRLKALLSTEHSYTTNPSLPDDVVELLSLRVAEVSALCRQVNAEAPEGLSELEARIKAFTESAAATSSERLAEMRQRNNRRAEVSILVELIGNFNQLADRLKNGRLSLQQDSAAARGALESELKTASDAFYEPLTTRQFAKALAAIRTLQEQLGPEPKAKAEGVDALQARLAEIGSISDQKAFAKVAEQLMIDARLELELLDRSIDSAVAALPITKRGQFEDKAKSRKTSMKAALQSAPALQQVVVNNSALDLDADGFKRCQQSTVELIGGFLSSVKYYQDFLDSLKAASRSFL